MRQQYTVDSTVWIRLFSSVPIFCRTLENITGYIINIDDINYYKDENGQYDYDR